MGVTICAVLLAVALRFDDGLRSAGPSGSDQPSVSAGGGFPRQATDASGRSVWIEAAPQAIGSQALAIDHFLFAISDLEQIVAVSPYALDPDYSFAHEIVAPLSLANSSNLEVVLRAKPDLMLLSHQARADHEAVLRQSGIPTFRVRTIFSDFEQIASEIAAVGFVTGNDSAAAVEIRLLHNRIEQARQRRPPRSRAVRVLAYSTYGSTLGRGSLFDHMLTELGAINVAAEQGIGEYGDIGSEQVAAWNPDWIVAAGERGNPDRVRTQLLADAGIAVTTAGRKGQILIVENRLFNSMSQHAVGLMETVAAAIYAEEK